MPDSYSVPPGLIVIPTWGGIQAETAMWWSEMRSFAEQHGIRNLKYQMVSGTLVDKVRNEAVRQMRNGGFQFLLMADGDMLGEPNALVAILETAFGTHQHLDVVGGFCNLRGDIALPTIDTGTGTWESWYPGQGVVEVMRTGAAFLLIKKHVTDRVPDPWFALRVPMKPLDAIAEIDTFCRTIFDGRNPFRERSDGTWETLVQHAASHHTNQGPWVAAEVGEDSSFCDRVTAAGMRIGVNTDIVVRHIVKQEQDWRSHKSYMERHIKTQRQLCGVFD